MIGMTATDVLKTLKELEALKSNLISNQGMVPAVPVKIVDITMMNVSVWTMK